MKSEHADKITVVFDTNVFISGYLWNGKARDALRQVRSKKYKLLYCLELLDELIRVLSSKFQLEVFVVHKIVQDIQNIGHIIPVISRDAPITADPTDNLFINLALDGKAACIVSGDSHLLKLKKHRGISILRSPSF